MVTYRSDLLIGGVKGGTEMAVPLNETDFQMAELPSPIGIVKPGLGPPKDVAVAFTRHHYRVVRMSAEGSDHVLEFFADASLSHSEACRAMWREMVTRHARPKT